MEKPQIKNATQISEEEIRGCGGSSTQEQSLHLAYEKLSDADAQAKQMKMEIEFLQQQKHRKAKYQSPFYRPECLRSSLLRFHGGNLVIPIHGIKALQIGRPGDLRLDSGS